MGGGKGALIRSACTSIYSCFHLDVRDRRRRGIPGHDVNHADVSHFPAGHGLLEAHKVSVEAALEGDETHHARLLDHSGNLGGGYSLNGINVEVDSSDTL